MATGTEAQGRVTQDMIWLGILVAVVVGVSYLAM
jgi:hypothetical protein